MMRIAPAVESRWTGATVRLGASGVSLGTVLRVEYVRGRYVAVVDWPGLLPTREALSRLRIVESDGGMESPT